MSVPASVVVFLVANGAALLLGVSLVLTAGAVAVVAARGSALRRWLGVVTACAAALYLAAAVAPLPRLAVPARCAPEPAAPAPSAGAEDLAMAAPPAGPCYFVDVGDAAAPPPAPRRAAAAPPQSDRAPGLPAGREAVAAAGPPVATGAGAGAGGGAAAIAALFLAGAALVLLHRLLGVARLVHVVRHSDPAPERLATAVALPRGATVRIARGAVRPFAFGVRRGGVVLPPELALPDAHATAVAVLRHEAAHLRAGDPRVQLLFAALAVPLFWHPLFWWLCRQVRLHSELLADSAAAERDLSGYVRSMLALAASAPRTAGAGAAAGAGAVFVFHRPSEFYRRLHMLLCRDVPLSPHLARSARWLPAASAALLAACCAAVLGAPPLVAQDPAPRSGRETALQEQVRALQQRIDELQAALQQLENTNRSERLRRAGNEQGALGRIVNDAELAKDMEDVVRRLSDPNVPEAAGDPGVEEPPPPPPEVAVDPAGVPGVPSHGPDVVDVEVRKGDSLEVMVGRVNHRVTPELLQRIRALNPGIEPTRLRIGQRIRVPFEHAGPPAAQPQQPPQPQGGGGNDPRLADLLAIATRCIELRGEVEMAKVRLEREQARAEAGQADVLEQRIAAIRLRTLEQQLQVAEQLAQGERQVLQQRLQVLQQLQANGLATAQDVHRLENFVQVLFGRF